MTFRSLVSGLRGAELDAGHNLASAASKVSYQKLGAIISAWHKPWKGPRLSALYSRLSSARPTRTTLSEGPGLHFH